MTADGVLDRVAGAQNGRKTPRTEVSRMTISEAQVRILDAADRIKSEGETTHVRLKLGEGGWDWGVDFRSLDKAWSVGGAGSHSLEQTVQDAIAGLHRPDGGAT